MEKSRRTAERQILVISTNWRIDVFNNRHFGIASVDVPSPFDYLNFKRGFPFTDPTHNRCALFALLLGLEIGMSTPEICDGGYGLCIATSRQQVHDLLSGDGWERTRRWCDDERRKPQKLMGFNRIFMRKVVSAIGELRSEGLGDIVCVPETKSARDGANVLAGHYANLDINEDDYGEHDGGGDGGEGDDLSVEGGVAQKRLDDMKCRQMLRNELIGISGCRAERMRRRPTRAEVGKQVQRISGTEKKDKGGDKDAHGRKIAASAAGGPPAEEPGTVRGVLSAEEGEARPAAGPPPAQVVDGGRLGPDDVPPAGAPGPGENPESGAPATIAATDSAAAAAGRDDDHPGRATITDE